MSALMIAAAAAIAGAMSDGEPVAGWTQADVLEVLSQSGLERFQDNTADADYPSVIAWTRDGFPVTIVRMACPGTPPAEEAVCSAAWLSAAIPSTGVEWGQKIVSSLGRFPTIGFTAFLTMQESSGRPYVHISDYVIADGGVSPDLLDFKTGQLIDVIEQTKGFMLSDDPGHAELWSRSE